MTKTEILFIRACKSKNPSVRLRSTYRRFYVGIDEYIDLHISYILAEICDKFLDLKTADILYSLHPRNNLNCETSYDIRCLNFLKSKIRFAAVSGLNGYVKPRRYR